MRKIDTIVIHCSDTPDGAYFDVDDIREWHTSPPRNWSDVGYHYIVLLDGTIQKGREDAVIGAHVKGFNSTSIGVCYIGGGDGEDTRTPKQKDTFIYLIGMLRRLYPYSKVLGHRDFKEVTKDCPCFDAISEYDCL